MIILRAILGIAFFLLVAWAMSSHKRRVNVRIVVAGVLLQVVLAFVILKTEPGRWALDGVSQGVTKFLSFSGDGAEFVFGPLTGYEYVPPEESPRPVRLYTPEDEPQLSEEAHKSWQIVFAFRALPTIIFFSAVMGILYHLGLVQMVVRAMARFMMLLMRVSGAESLAMAANVFIGQTEAPLVIRPYLNVLTRSELMALMTGGFATIAGSVLAAFIGFLEPTMGAGVAGHLLAASFMSAPAAFVIAKIMIPETEESKTGGEVEFEVEKTTKNVLDAAAAGTSDGLKLALNVCAMLIAFVSIVYLIDWPLSALSIGGEPLSLHRIFGWVFSPVAWMIGVAWADCQIFGGLLGSKIAVTEFYAFAELGNPDVGGEMSERSRTMAAYALCGFANVASIGIQLGGIGALAPERRSELSELALRAMIGGAFASWMTATIAGAMI